MSGKRTTISGGGSTLSISSAGFTLTAPKIRITPAKPTDNQKGANGQSAEGKPDTKNNDGKR